MEIKILAFALVFSALGICPGVAGDKIWVGLYHAENSAPAANAVLAPEKLSERLTAVFGFKHYTLVKAQDIEMDNKWQQWAVPRTDFFIRVEPLPEQPGQPKVVYYEIYKDGFIVAKGKYEPHNDTPLFINGPDFKQGRLIFVLEAR
jgi:hypothetical protein